MSLIFVILYPALFNARTAESLPGPGPFTKTSKFLSPNTLAFWPAFSAAICAANGVLFLDPLNPEPPEVAQASVLPCLFVIVTIVLLKDAFMCATPSVTIFLVFFFLDLSTIYLALSNFLGPLRVLLLFLVFWPRSGNPFLCLIPL